MNNTSTVDSIALLLMIVVGVGLIVLQIFLSKKENKWPGLILPIISFCVSVVAVLGITLFSVNTATLSVTTNGVLVEQAKAMAGNTSALIAMVVYTFLIINIPTAVFVVIYAACRKSNTRKRELERMSLQDLG